MRPEAFFSLQLPDEARVLVTGDVHGNPALLNALLTKVRYRPGEDFLIILGDTVEKGPDCLGALKLVHSLSQNKRVYTILGNVDRWYRRLLYGTWADAEQYTNFRPDNTLTQIAALYGVGQLTQNTYFELCRRFQADYRYLSEWLERQPSCIETSDYIFVHAGIPAKSDWKDCDENELRSNYDFYEKRVNLSGKWVIAGHVPCYYVNSGPNYKPFIDEKNKVVLTDGGTITHSRQLNMLIISRSGGRSAFSYACVDGLIPGEATRDVAGDMSALVKITHLTNKVEVLEPGKNFSKVRCVASGQTGLAKNEMISDGVYWGELSAFLPVSAGEAVGIVSDSMTGWAYVKNHIGDMGFVPLDAIKRV